MGTILIPASIATLLGSILIVGAVKFIFYAMDRDGNIFYVALFGGFPFFGLGFALIFFCFLPNPPPIFWFAVEPWWHWG